MTIPLEKPWYRHLLVWLVIAIPVAGILMAGVTAIVAHRHADVEISTGTTAPPLSKTSWRERNAS